MAYYDHPADRVQQRPDGPATSRADRRRVHITLQRMEKEWAALARSPEARRALRRWDGSEALAGADSLGEILERRRQSPVRAKAVLAALAARAGDDDVAARTLLQAMLPGLIVLGRRLTASGWPWSGTNVMADALSCAWVIIRRYPVHRTSSVALNVVRDTERALLRQRPSREVPYGGEPNPGKGLARSAEDEAMSGIASAGFMVTDAWRRGVITRFGARVIFESRVIDRPIAELAATAGVSAATMYRARLAAEAQLRDHLALAG